MAAAKVAGVGDSHRARTRIPRGNMRAKLLDYIGQVFECKAEGPHYLRRVLGNWRVERVKREERNSRDGSEVFLRESRLPRTSCLSR